MQAMEAMEATTEAMQAAMEAMQAAEAAEVAEVVDLPPLGIPRSRPRSARPVPLPELKPRPTHPPVVDLRYVHSASSLLAYLGRLICRYIEDLGFE
jgi:hypothetical protein